MTLKEAQKGILLLQWLWNDGRLQRRTFNDVGNLYVSLQLYCWAILWGYLWHHISYHGNAQGAQKRPLNFSFCKLSGKTNSVTYYFYLFVGKFPKFFNFSDSIETSYLVELNIFLKNAIYSLKKILLDNFLWNFYIWSANVNGAFVQKIKVGHRAKFRARNKYFLQILLPVRAILRKI